MRSGLIQDAIKLVEQIYRSTGVTIEWLDCTPALRQEAVSPGCHDRLRPTTLMVQLLSRKMTKGVPVSSRVYGYAVPEINRAGLFFGRIEDYSVAHGLEQRALLGMVLAHEIGHVLLGKGSHSGAGLMRCPWTKKNITDAARGLLSFAPKQARMIHQEVLARVEAEASASLAAD